MPHRLWSSVVLRVIPPRQFACLCQNKFNLLNLMYVNKVTLCMDLVSDDNGTKLDADMYALLNIYLFKKGWSRFYPSLASVFYDVTLFLLALLNDAFALALLNMQSYVLALLNMRSYVLALLNMQSYVLALLNESFCVTFRLPHLCHYSYCSNRNSYVNMY